MARIIGELEKALGKGRKKAYAGALSVAHGDTIDTGLSSLDAVALTPINTSPRDCHPTSVSGGVITVGLWDGDPALAAITTITTAESVMVLAVGDPR